MGGLIKSVLLPTTPQHLPLVTLYFTLIYSFIPHSIPQKSYKTTLRIGRHESRAAYTRYQGEGGDRTQGPELPPDHVDDVRVPRTQETHADIDFQAETTGTGSPGECRGQTTSIDDLAPDEQWPAAIEPPSPSLSPARRDLRAGRATSYRPRE